MSSMKNNKDTTEFEQLMRVGIEKVLPKVREKNENKILKYIEKIGTPSDYVIRNIKMNLTLAIREGDTKEAIEIIRQTNEKGLPKKNLGDILSDDIFAQRVIGFHFDKDIVKELEGCGYRPNIHVFKQQLFHKRNDDLLEYILKNDESKLSDIFENTLNSFLPDISDKRREMLCSYRSKIIKLFPEIIQTRNDLLQKPSTQRSKECMVFLNYGDGGHLLGEDRNYLENITVKSWEVLLGDMFGSMNAQPYYLEEKMISLLNICKDFKNASDAMKNIENDTGQKNDVENFLNKWIGKNTDYEDTAFYKTADKIIESWPDDKKRNKHLLLASIYITKNKALGFDLYTNLLTDPSSVSEICHFQKMNDCPSIMRHNHVNGLLEHDSWIEEMVVRGNYLQQALLETDRGKEVLYEAITKNIRNTFEWTKTDWQVMAKILRAIPKLNDWRDDFGNNLAHYMTYQRSDLNKTAMQTMIRRNHEWFSEENKEGHTPREFMDKKLKHSDLIAIDREIIKRGVKSEGGKRKKVKKRVI